MPPVMGEQLDHVQGWRRVVHDVVDQQKVLPLASGKSPASQLEAASQSGYQKQS